MGEGSPEKKSPSSQHPDNSCGHGDAKTIAPLLWEQDSAIWSPGAVPVTLGAWLRRLKPCCSGNQRELPAQRDHSLRSSEGRSRQPKAEPYTCNRQRILGSRPLDPAGEESQRALARKAKRNPTSSIGLGHENTREGSAVIGSEAIQTAQCWAPAKNQGRWVSGSRVMGSDHV